MVCNLFKRGYENGEKTIEIFEGNIDVVLYSEDASTFYFYRFSPEEVFGETLGVNNEYDRKKIEKIIAQFNENYDELIIKLVDYAVKTNRKFLYEM